MKPFLIALVILASAGCASKEVPSEPWDGLCEVRLSYTETAATPRVFVAGSFNDFHDGEDELVDDGTGRYSIALRLAPGVYPYKLVVHGDGADMWRLDPGNAYRVYENGIENSGLRVADCSRPSLELTTQASSSDGSADATIAYAPNHGGALGTITATLHSNSQSSRALTPSELTRTGNELSVHLSGLSRGKHTVFVRASSSSGVESEELIVPFWIDEEAFTWNDAVIYMVMTDRFRNGDTANDPAASDASLGADWQGGDFAGVTQAIEEGYFDRLGVNALWLTPYNQNPDGTYTDADETHRVTGYHGYWPTDPTGVDTRLGGADALHALIDSAHAHGIRVLMDLVLNHVHEEHPYFSQHPSWFNTGCVCGTSGCDWTEHRLDCLFRPYLPDINWANNEASETFVADALSWMRDFDLDGFRVDAVKHVNDAAVFNLAMRVRESFGRDVFLMGETAMGWDSSSGPEAGGNLENYGTISRYIGPNALNGQFDFVLYYAGALQFLTDTAGRGMAHIDYWSSASMREYPEGAIMTPYIGSHDTSRFITLASHPELASNKWDNLPPAPNDESYDRMYVAFGWLFALPGAPLLYYGDEYGEYGAADPDNRHMMRFSTALNARETTQLERVSALVTARRNIPALRSRRSHTLYADEDLWVALRGEGEESCIVVVNRAAAAKQLLLPIANELVNEGRVFIDALDATHEVSVTRNALAIDMPPRSVRYLR